MHPIDHLALFPNAVPFLVHPLPIALNHVQIHLARDPHTGQQYLRRSKGRDYHTK